MSDGAGPRSHGRRGRPPGPIRGPAAGRHAQLSAPSSQPAIRGTINCCHLRVACGEKEGGCGKGREGGGGKGGRRGRKEEGKEGKGEMEGNGARGRGGGERKERRGRDSLPRAENPHVLTSSTQRRDQGPAQPATKPADPLSAPRWSKWSSEGCNSAGLSPKKLPPASSQHTHLHTHLSAG